MSSWSDPARRSAGRCGARDNFAVAETMGRAGRGPNLLGPVVCNVAGVLLVVGGWMAVAHQPGFGDQLAYFNLGAAGVILAGVGDVVFLFGFRDLLRRRMGRLAARPRLVSRAGPR